MENELKEWLELHKFYMYSDYLTRDLAQYLKVSPRTIQRWVQGAVKPRQVKLKLISQYLQEKRKKISLQQDL